MLIYRCGDLMFGTRVRAAAEDAGLTTRPVRNIDMLRNRLDQIDDGKPNEPVETLVVELTGDPLDIELIEVTKAHHTAITVIAFGPHVDTQSLLAAQNAGADHVMTRGAFTKQLPDLMRHLATR